MPNETTQPQQVYGFAYEEPFLWPETIAQKVKDAIAARAAVATEPQSKPAIDVAETTKEICEINPRVGQEIHRLLAEPQPAASAASAPTSICAVSGPVSNSATATNTPTPSAAPSSPTSDVTAASAIIDVTSPPANPRSPTSRTSPATQESAAPATQPAAPSSPASTPAPEAAKTARPQRARLLTPLERHQSRCGICGHELQDEIDGRFVNWEHVGHLADEYKISRTALYRHVNATGLFEKRDRNIRRSLGHIIHNAAHAFTTGDTVVRAVKVFAHINTRGEWTNPPSHVIVETKRTNGSTARAAKHRPQKLSGTAHRIKRRAKH